MHVSIISVNIGGYHKYITRIKNSGNWTSRKYHKHDNNSIFTKIIKKSFLFLFVINETNSYWTNFKNSFTSEAKVKVIYKRTNKITTSVSKFDAVLILLGSNMWWASSRFVFYLILKKHLFNLKGYKFEHLYLLANLRGTTKKEL